MFERPPSVTTLKARWIFPVDGPPLEDAVIAIQGEKILSLETGGGRANLDLGNVAILPGLVNAHTHLDLSGLRGRLPPKKPVTDWLRGVIQRRRSLSPLQAAAEIQAGLAECVRYGTTLVGDISGEGLSWPILAAAPLWSVVFYEILGLSRARARQALASAKDWLEAHRANARCRPGLSPHAPYSVRHSLFRAIAGLARHEKVPVAIHLAESREELELLQHHDGPFVPFLSDLGVWDPDGLAGEEEILRMYADRPNTLWIHTNYLDAGLPISPHGTVIYCPRTHAAFGHAPHPFRRFLDAGIRVALGTDSLASNPDLDVLSEARLVRQLHPDLPGHVLLRMATLAGAEALGYGAETGSLATGKSADLIVLPVDGSSPNDPHDFILSSSARVESVMWRGRWILGPLAP
jgi:cytosine/adenosine deaminase-related metal-dependent hydrolase